MTHGSLFSGIGGFDLAAEWAGWENTFQVEINNWSQRVLRKNFPNAKQYGDIKQFDGTDWRGKIDVISGGFPCQPYSSAGLRKGTEDERHLWPEMLRVIREVAPKWVVGENVFGIVTWENGLVFEQVHLDLEVEGYEVQAFVLPAASTDAPHRRDRTWFIAHSTVNTCNHENKSKRQARPYPIPQKGFDGNPQPKPSVSGMDDGIPGWMDEIRGLGNAIVPQVAYRIFDTINAFNFG